MSYAFGWWDFVEVDGEPQMVCRDSDERVVMVRDLEEPWLAKAIAEHPKRPESRWRRFEYRHEEFWFPLIVNWVPEEGRILVDYNLSSKLWRLETNAETEHPPYAPYGGWVRVDDMVPDAFWCWPRGMLANLLHEEEQLKKSWGICLIGKWHCDRWEPVFFSRETQMLKYFALLDYTDEPFEWIPDKYLRELYLHFHGVYVKENLVDGGYPKLWDSKKREYIKVDHIPRKFYGQISDESDGGEWVYTFDTVENAQAVFDSFGSRILLTDDLSKYNLCTSRPYVVQDFLRNDVADKRPFLLRQDGKAAIMMLSDFQREAQGSSFFFFWIRGSN